MPNYYHKPENALRRAAELQGIKQPEAALALLHEVLASRGGGRSHKTWSTTYEKIMIVYLDLCLALTKSREAKDGLHQYRNLSQQQAPGSLEKVIRHLITSAEKKCAEAKAKSEKRTGVEGVDAPLGDDAEDMESSATSQSILFSTMNIDPEQTQRETSLLLPSLKFLWETYRTVLDILRSNSKLEHLYHGTAVSALGFCRSYKRRTEFRRLCEMLRQHLGNLQKYGNVPSTPGGDGKNKGLRGWEGWTTESIELHLQTRFAQLETASSLELYTESFRTVEDIYGVMQIGRRMPKKARLMATYYEKLIGIFWVSENLLFHAFAWYKYYTLCREYNRSMSEETKGRQASCVLLAALCIPTLESGGVVQSSGSNMSQKGNGITTVEDEIAREKTDRMANLLGFQTNPTRAALLLELKSKNLMDVVPQYLRDLHALIEESHDPLTLVEKARPLLETLRKESLNDVTDEGKDGGTTSGASSPSLGRYIKPLTNVLLLKLLLTLSTTYHTVSLNHMKQITNGLGMAFEEVETGIVVATRAKLFSVTIDHQANCLRFGDEALESESMRDHLRILGRRLASVSNIIHPPDTNAKLERRVTLFNSVRQNLAKEHLAVLERKNEIEKRKEEVERLAQITLKKEIELKAKEEALRQQEEARRLMREKRLRDKQKEQMIQQELDLMKKSKILEDLGRSAENMNAAELAEIDTEALAKQHADKVTKKKEAAERKLKEIAKRLDYITRAIRIEELPLIQTRFEERNRADRERYEKETEERLETMRGQWGSDVEKKQGLEKHDVFAHTSVFEDLIMEGRVAVHEEACAVADTLAEQVAEKEKIERARRRKQDEIKRLEEEEQARIEEEKARIKAEEAARKEEERLKKELEEEESRKKEMERMREEQMKKEREREQNRPAPPPMSSRMGGGGGNKYVPPSQRGNTDRGGGDDRGGSDRYGSRDGGKYGSGGGGGYGGGRYDRDQRGGDRGAGSDRYGSRDGGGGGGYDRRDRGGDRDGGARDGGARDGGARDGGAQRNSRWS